MPRIIRVLPCLAVLGLAVAGLSFPFRTTTPAAAQEKGNALDKQFATTVQPFLARYCVSCHGPKKQAATLDLSLDATPAAVAKNAKTWELAFERVHAKEMPPETSTKQPTAEERDAVVKWFRDLRTREAEKHAGDPGTVLARRLSSAEFDYTVRDLTGVDIRPARDFPVDPANQSGFDNSGESLAMSPALLKKYLAAARLVADHVVLKPEGFVFAPHPAVTDTDRDKYCVQRVVDFYKRHEVDLADYFLAAWKYGHRAKLGKADAKLENFATDAKLSEKYLAVVWAALTEGDASGPLAASRAKWNAIPPPDPATPQATRGDCEKLRDLVVKLRKPLKPDAPKLSVSGMSQGSQPLVLWRNRQFASTHRSYAGDAAADLKKLAEQFKTDAAVAKLLAVEKPDEDAARKLRADLERFCSAFPDAFVVVDRGPYFEANAANKGRPLTAGFHLMHGHFRDDAPLCELILNDRERKELDALWAELDFVTLSPQRQYKDFIFFERAEPPRFMFEAEFDFARSEDKDSITEAKIAKLEEVYLAKARKKKASDAAMEAIQTYFATISADIRRVEKARLAAEPGHLDSLVKFAERAYRRPLKVEEKADLLAFYKQLRTKGELSHEDAIRDAIASVLLSPHVCYRVDLAQPGAAARPLTDYELASRLSYFLWSSMPDEELLARAAAGDLHKPEVLKAQARRMLRDPKVRGLATEFAGNFLDFRRFEEHNAVDRERFPQFTNELRHAMFEEPVRYFVDVARRDRSVLDLLHGTDTFVNRPLAKHYGMPFGEPGAKGEPGASATGARDEWLHVENADKFGRGGILPMALFQTKNAPGLRTSPVKRGYWVVSKVLGERIPPPPPAVPELPKDESKLGDLTLPQVLARHRADKACAGCHNRFDAVGLVFEGFGPVGELRAKDLGGKPVATTATFPDAKDRTGLDGLRSYLRDKRQDDFLDNLCRKLLSYGLGRSLLLSDQKTLDAMRARLTNDKHAFGSLVESIVTSPQFLNKRGRDDARE
jgi:mono/diheme cytochrome c family protein